ncbi:Zinc finger protein 574 [Amphibalanus amphitrite]|uniref:Zinc finger protein 574 n=1 Tax=Amphibalanus amphitrite TaxID=1232801 RepID=A0A6A4VHL9_AMPAM|nr:Zinc finger protein 574 [Amphibalanus amphitrite]
MHGSSAVLLLCGISDALLLCAAGHAMTALRCPFCHKTFKSRDSLRNHRALHEGRTACNICHVIAGLQCSVCHKTFKSQNSLRNHRALHEGRTLCNVCGKVFSTLSNLSEHRRVFHRSWRSGQEPPLP